MRHYVLRACAALSIPVVQEAPHWSSHATWLEAFLTNRLADAYCRLYHDTAFCATMVNHRQSSSWSLMSRMSL
jgi:hypothetical protein